MKFGWRWNHVAEDSGLSPLRVFASRSDETAGVQTVQTGLPAKSKELKLDKSGFQPAGDWFVV